MVIVRGGLRPRDGEVLEAVLAEPPLKQMN